MTIKQLTLYTNQLAAQKQFYNETLGFQLIENEAQKFAIQVGKSKVSFQASVENHLYHYCFLIPCNQLQAAIYWLQSRLEVLDIEKGRIIQRFESWNADSVYFYDGAGNLAEFIVRYDLENDSDTVFGTSSILCLNEIGMPTKDIKQINQQIEIAMNTLFWKGDQERFGTHGTPEGLLLLPNYEIKTTWFPTTLKIRPAPLKAVIKNNGTEYNLIFEEEVLKITMV